MRSFGSDNHSGIHPAILSAIQQANTGHAPGYGNDPWSERAIKRLKAIFGEDSEVLFVFTGTAANMISIAPLVQSYNSIICSSSAHLWIDECGGPETFTGCKLD